MISGVKSRTHRRSNKMKTLYIICLLLLVCCTSPVSPKRKRRSVSNSLGSVLASRGLTNKNKRKKAPVKITPPLRLKPGETAEQPPGWQHCIKNIRSNLSWKSFKSPGYPDFLESQIQCSWIIEAPIGMRVKVAFRDLDMVGVTGSCAKQFVQIIDTATGKSQGRFCGATRPGDYVTLGTKVRIDLQADKAVTEVRGFLISFTAVKEIPGFRSTKTFPAMTKGGNGAPGKIDIKNFASHVNSNTPKTPAGNKRGNKRLVYNSDLNPTDPAGTPTEESPANTIGTDQDSGWIGNDADITNGPNPSNRSPNGGPLKYRTGGGARQRNPRPTNNAGQIVITQSTQPVRIRAKNLVTPSPPPEEETENESEGPVIYGKENQPYDPNLYSTQHPVRGDPNRFIDHRPEALTTTNLIIIIACSAMLLFIILAIVLFFWFYRRRRKQKKKAEKKNKKVGKGNQGEVEMNVMSLSDGDNGNSKVRQRELPGPPPLSRDSPPRYLDRREFSHPRGVALDRRDREISDSVQRGRELPTISRSGMPGSFPHEDSRRDAYTRDVRRYPPEFQRYPGHPEDIRHHTIDPRRQHTGMPASQNHHRSLDPRNLERDHQIDNRRLDFRRQEPPPYLPQNTQPGYPPRYKNGVSPRDNTRPGPFPNGITGVDDVDNDCCSEVSNDSGSSNAPMRREYSPWELEKQKKERRKKLINGEI